MLENAGVFGGLAGFLRADFSIHVWGPEGFQRASRRCGFPAGSCPRQSIKAMLDDGKPPGLPALVASAEAKFPSAGQAEPLPSRLRTEGTHLPTKKEQPPRAAPDLFGFNLGLDHRFLLTLEHHPGTQTALDLGVAHRADG